MLQRQRLPLLGLLAATAALACAFGELRPGDPFKRELSLEEQHTRYSELVRWSKFDEASDFVTEEDRTAYLAAMPSFDDVRFTDWEATPWRLTDEDKRTATIEVTYRGYGTRTMVEVAVHERQEWTRGSANSWTLRSTFRDLDRLAARAGH